MNRWIKVEDRKPTKRGEYIVEYVFDHYPKADMRFRAIHEFYPAEDRFQHEGFRGLRVIRWAYMPED